MHHGIAERRLADLHVRVALDAERLPVERLVIAVFAQDHFGHQRVGEDALLDDFCRGRGDADAHLLALGACQLFAQGHFDVILGGLHAKSLAGFVADDLFLALALRAAAVGLATRNNLLDARQVRRQRLANGHPREFHRAGLRAGGGCLDFLGQRGLAGHFVRAHARFQFQKQDLRVAQLLRTGAIAPKPLQAQRLREQAVFHLQCVKLRKNLWPEEFGDFG